MLIQHEAVHLGIATQTGDGLKVPVVRHAEARDLDGLAAEIRRVSTAARDNTATREELGGSTITITSLGKLGGIVSTPIINQPEVGIIGVNKMVERPVVVGGRVEVRTMMNLSSSFDHRFVDGYEGAAMIQALERIAGATRADFHVLIPPLDVDHRQQRLPCYVTPQILADQQEQPITAFVGPPGRVRADDHARRRPQRMAFRQRLRVGYIESGPGNLAVTECGDQVVGDRARSAPHRYEIGGRLHGLKKCRVEHASGLVR